MSLSSAANLAPLPASAYSRLIGQEKWALAQHSLLKGPISSLIATQNQISSFKFTLCPGGATRVGENTLYPLSLRNKKGKFLLRAKLLPPLLWLADCFGVFGDRDTQPAFNRSFWGVRVLYPGFGTSLGARWRSTSWMWGCSSSPKQLHCVAQCGAAVTTRRSPHCAGAA